MSVSNDYSPKIQPERCIGCSTPLPPKDIRRGHILCRADAIEQAKNERRALIIGRANNRVKS